MVQLESLAGNGSTAGLIAAVVLLAAGYVALDFYAEGEKNKVLVETRGTQFLQALYHYRQDAGRFPDTLESLVPRQLALLPRCPGGESYVYVHTNGEYRVGCPNVGFKTRSYGYDSRSRSWRDW
ncbi:MAG: hypothetical protein IT514_02370 [Burkholderiales bacterium]|nr:hypothetical protein [Burkholderiales bacterium]